MCLAGRMCRRVRNVPNRLGPMVVLFVYSVVVTQPMMIVVGVTWYGADHPYLCTAGRHQFQVIDKNKRITLNQTKRASYCKGFDYDDFSGIHLIVMHGCTHCVTPDELYFIVLIIALGLRYGRSISFLKIAQSLIKYRFYHTLFCRISLWNRRSPDANLAAVGSLTV